jgi:hypothetical protein
MARIPELCVSRSLGDTKAEEEEFGLHNLETEEGGEDWIEWYESDELEDVVVQQLSPLY